MEKRALLAIILSIIVLVLYQYFFIPPPKEVKKEKKKKEVIKKERVISTFLPSKKIKPTYIELENNLVKVVFSSKGGSLKEVILKKYWETYKKKKNIRLIKDLNLLEENPYLEIRDSDSWIKLKEENFSFKKRKNEIIFKYQDFKNLSIAKHFILRNYYVLDFFLEIYNNGTNPIDLSKFSIFWDISRIKKKNLKLAAFINNDFFRKNIQKIKNDIIKKGEIKFIAIEDPYFTFSILPESRVNKLIIYSLNSKKTSVGFSLPKFLLKAKHKYKVSLRLYTGPKKEELLKLVGRNLDRLIDYGWSSWLAKILLKLLNNFYKLTGNYGYSIIILTLLIQIVFFPLTYKGFKSIKKLQELQPKMDLIRKRYKNDPKKMNEEIINLYKTYKVNPLGGCLPLLLQIPVFFALYKILLTYISLRHAPFILWIKDLSSPDTVGRLPFIGIPLNILPILMGIASIFQQKLSSASDPRQAKIAYIMPIFLTLIFWNFPSGLVLYWLSNNIFTIFQQLLIKKL